MLQQVSGTWGVGARWEVEFFADGSVEVEVFVSSGGVQGPELLTRLFQEFSGLLILAE